MKFDISNPWSDKGLKEYIVGNRKCLSTNEGLLENFYNPFN